MDIPPQLIAAISRRSDRSASAAVRLLIDEILARHGKAAQAILFYGSCLRTGDDLDGLVDLYLLVDNYRAAYTSRIQAFFNVLLPYMALFTGKVKASKITDHCKTNIYTIKKFLDVKFKITNKIITC